MNDSKTILVVEDTAAMRNIERLVLERAGYNVIEASTVPEAIALLETVRPDFPLRQFNFRFGFPAALHRIPPRSQIDREYPQGQRACHARDSATIDSAQRRGTSRRNIC